MSKVLLYELKYCLIGLILLFLLMFPVELSAQTEECPNRYVTIVNPIRSRERWYDRSLKPLKDQANAISKHDLSATWLLQYDTLFDKELQSELGKFKDNHEKGVFLEVSQKLADDAKVVYPYDAAWFSPRAIFLSGYSPKDRRLLIDTLYKSFKRQHGYYPKSVGAWWIDSYSLDYLKNKYGIRSALIVADQLSTDNYGVWGQWWGVPYYPSKSNILVPASSSQNKQDVVILQWAQRDLTRAYGDSPKYSNYSLQANDYIRQGENTDYFKNLVSDYLGCQNSLGQITVGLETGIESVGYIDEYENQMNYLSTIPNLRSVTMSEFSEEFKKVYPEFPKEIKLESTNSAWILTTERRINSKLDDEVIYKQNISFADFFLADKNDFLDRNLNKIEAKNNKNYFPWFLIVLFGVFLYAVNKRKRLIFFGSLLFSIVAFGLILRSFYKNGWQVNYGPNVPLLEVWQIIVIILPFVFFLLLERLIKFKNPMLFITLSLLTYGFDFIIKFLRFSYISGVYYLGFASDNLRIWGISFQKPLKFSFFDKDFPGYQAAAFLKIDFNDLVQNLYFSFLISPIIHILVGGLVYIVVKKTNSRIKIAILTILAFLLLFHLIVLLNQDPLSVKTI